MKRRPLRPAGRICAATAASRWGGPDFTTPVQAVAKSEPEDLRVRDDHTINR
jgi:hypothetical protein